MRRIQHVPEIDMTSMMGLTAILIALLLMSSQPPYAVLESEIPGFALNSDATEVVTPTIELTRNEAFLTVGDTKRVPIGGVAGIAAALDDVRGMYEVDGRWQLVPNGDVPYNDIVEAVDEARSVRFNTVTFNGGALIPNAGRSVP
jgi:hypothetical protein